MSRIKEKKYIMKKKIWYRTWRATAQLSLRLGRRWAGHRVRRQGARHAGTAQEAWAHGRGVQGKQAHGRWGAGQAGARALGRWAR